MINLACFILPYRETSLIGPAQSMAIQKCLPPSSLTSFSPPLLFWHLSDTVANTVTTGPTMIQLPEFTRQVGGICLRGRYLINTKCNIRQIRAYPRYSIGPNSFCNFEPCAICTLRSRFWSHLKFTVGTNTPWWINIVSFKNDQNSDGDLEVEKDSEWGQSLRSCLNH